MAEGGCDGGEGAVGDGFVGVNGYIRRGTKVREKFVAVDANERTGRKGMGLAEFLS